MTKPITKASWIGKAAYEIGTCTGCDGSAAHLEATRMADDLSDYGIDLGRVNPRQHARSIHGASLVGGRMPANTFANDNGAPLRLCLSIRGDCTIFQIDVHEEGEVNSLEVRVPIDFLRGLREAKGGAVWRDAHGTVIVPSGRNVTLGLACRRGETGVVIELDDLGVMNLELVLSQTLNRSEREDCGPFPGSLVNLERRMVKTRHAA